MRRIAVLASVAFLTLAPRLCFAKADTRPQFAVGFEGNHCWLRAGNVVAVANEIHLVADEKLRRKIRLSGAVYIYSAKRSRIAADYAEIDLESNSITYSSSKFERGRSVEKDGKPKTTIKLGFNFGRTSIK